jgi:hypothetical protein
LGSNVIRPGAGEIKSVSQPEELRSGLHFNQINKNDRIKMQKVEAETREITAAEGGRGDRLVRRVEIDDLYIDRSYCIAADSEVGQ